MNIDLYQNYSQPNKLYKNLSYISRLTGNLREESSAINPSILIQYDGFITANYCYIPEFNRYYFITNITSVRNNLWRIDCKVDVLQTYNSYISSNDCVLARSEYYYNLYLHDNDLPIYEDTFTSTEIFPNDNFNTWKNILILGGSK